MLCQASGLEGLSRAASRLVSRFVLATVRKVVIAGNWKMHMTCAEAQTFADTFRPLLADLPDDRQVVLAPPFTAIASLSTALAGSGVKLSAQNIHWQEKGAFTGMISAPMLLEHGVTHAIVGHSEPRKYYSETDEQINLRARSAQKHGITPILCVGESDSQREAGEAERVIRRQVEQGVDGLDPARLIVAYEPIWAIGTGKTCEAVEANRLCGLIREWVGYPDVVVQYGGSVNPSTIDLLMAQPEIDGVLVGGASLDPEGFARIANYQVPVMT
jgi:triosephosphate isomerase